MPPRGRGGAGCRCARRVPGRRSTPAPRSCSRSSAHWRRGRPAASRSGRPFPRPRRALRRLPARPLAPSQGAARPMRPARWRDPARRRVRRCRVPGSEASRAASPRRRDGTGKRQRSLARGHLREDEDVGQRPARDHVGSRRLRQRRRSPHRPHVLRLRLRDVEHRIHRAARRRWPAPTRGRRPRFLATTPARFDPSRASPGTRRDGEKPAPALRNWPRANRVRSCLDQVGGEAATRRPPPRRRRARRSPACGTRSSELVLDATTRTDSFEVADLRIDHLPAAGVAVKGHGCPTRASPMECRGERLRPAAGAVSKRLPAARTVLASSSRPVSSARRGSRPRCRSTALVTADRRCRLCRRAIGRSVPCG